MTGRERQACVVVDLGFGDSGKGSIVDYLVRKLNARLVVRWNGGAQAGHTVVLDDGRHHTFSQFGAGTFSKGVRTHLTRDVVIHPTALLVEARVLAGKGVSDALERLAIDECARVITPYHQAANRLRELARGQGRHGSCGVGVGETVRDSLEHRGEALLAHDLVGDRARLRSKLKQIHERVRASVKEELRLLAASDDAAVFTNPGVLEAWMAAIEPLRSHGLVVAGDALDKAWSEGSVVLEGAQGVLLDERVGFHPHTSWGTCTATELLRDHRWNGSVERMGVLRTYLTRHGQGPFATEDPYLGKLPERHNEEGGFQGPFRRGWPDLVIARYALAACPELDCLALTHADCLSMLPSWKAAYQYRGSPAPGKELRTDSLRSGDLEHQAILAEQLKNVTPVYLDMPRECDAFAERLEAELGVEVRITSHGPTARDTRVRWAPSA